MILRWSQKLEMGLDVPRWRVAMLNKLKQNGVQMECETSYTYSLICKEWFEPFSVHENLLLEARNSYFAYLGLNGPYHGEYLP